MMPLKQATLHNYGQSTENWGKDYKTHCECRKISQTREENDVRTFKQTSEYLHDKNCRYQAINTS